jgi:hypothetical protein
VTSVINRYYDPTTNQFLSIDPGVALTDQPYVFSNDDPLNSEDALGQLPTTGQGETDSQTAAIGNRATQYLAISSMTSSEQN